MYHKLANQHSCPTQRTRDTKC